MLRCFKFILPIIILASVLVPSGIAMASSPSVDDVKVYKNYDPKDPEGWLVVFVFNNSEPPYFNYSDPTLYWRYELWANNSLEASIPMSQWGLRPGSIFISSSTAASLQWAATNYEIRLQSTYNTSLNCSRDINVSDWRGNAITEFDAWVTSQAKRMQVYDGATYITVDQDYGEILNYAGGTIFNVGIPYLSTYRPNLFQFTIQTINVPYNNATNHSYATSLDDWQTAIGPELSTALTDTGGIFGISGRTVGGLLIFIAFATLSSMGVAMGHYVAGTIFASLMIMAGIIIGLIPIVIILVATMLLVLVFIRGWWFSST